MFGPMILHFIIVNYVRYRCMRWKYKNINYEFAVWMNMTTVWRLEVGVELVLLPGQLTPLICAVLEVRIPGHVHVDGPQGRQQSPVQGHDVDTPQDQSQPNERRMPDVSQQTPVLGRFLQQWLGNLLDLAVHLNHAQQLGQVHQDRSEADRSPAESVNYVVGPVDGLGGEHVHFPYWDAGQGFPVDDQELKWCKCTG